MYKIRININGEIVDDFISNGDNTILEDAIKNEIDLPHSCKVGLCESCSCKVLGSCESNMGSIVEGYILTCQSKAKSDLILLFD